MKLIDLITEADQKIGVVVSKKKDGTFYDIDFVDFDSLKPLTGHVANLGKSFIKSVKEDDSWEAVFPFFQKKFSSKKLGEDYSSEDANFYLFGPISEQQMNLLPDKL